MNWLKGGFSGEGSSGGNSEDEPKQKKSWLERRREKKEQKQTKEAEASLAQARIEEMARSNGIKHGDPVCVYIKGLRGVLFKNYRVIENYQGFTKKHRLKGDYPISALDISSIVRAQSAKIYKFPSPEER